MRADQRLRRGTAQRLQQAPDVELLWRVLERVRTEALETISVRAVDAAQVALEVLVGDQVQQMADALGVCLLPQPLLELAAVIDVVADLVEDQALDDVAAVGLAAQHR